MKVGKLVYDYALGRNGLVVGGSWIEKEQSDLGLEGWGNGQQPIPWEWLVLYNNGELMGADTNDLKELTS